MVINGFYSHFDNRVCSQFPSEIETTTVDHNMRGRIKTIFSQFRNKHARYKVLKLKSSEDNNCIFECKELDIKRSKQFQFKMSILLEAANRAFSIMKSPKDIFRHGQQWKIENRH
jgi:hypothetical protein